ncbi:uncharacterized protein LOC142465742 [Ascaphus truei]|uniref:uncharacterized protein LOC142465742 n=1 Tax=Ascaphus truei TaxID=8439 RepID=UPI003F5A9360
MTPSPSVTAPPLCWHLCYSCTSRCFLWDRGTSDDSSWVPEEGELRVSMVIKGQTQCEKLVNSSGLKSTCDAVTSEVTPKARIQSRGVREARGKRKRNSIKEEEGENVCPNRGQLKGQTPQRRGNSSKGGTLARLFASPKVTEATIVTPTPLWGHALCPMDSQTVILIGGQGSRMQFCKDAMWKLNTDTRPVCCRGTCTYLGAGTLLCAIMTSTSWIWTPRPGSLLPALFSSRWTLHAAPPGRTGRGGGGCDSAGPADFRGRG